MTAPSATLHDHDLQPECSYNLRRRHALTTLNQRKLVTHRDESGGSHTCGKDEKKSDISDTVKGIDLGPSF